MNRAIIYKILLLAALWIVLFERFNVPVLILGLAIGAGCVFICIKLLPPSKTRNINFFRLFLFVFYLIGQVYLAGFNAVKLIFTGANIHVVEMKIKISNKFLRTILANSITLTPCTILLEMEDDTFTVLYIKERKKEAMKSDSVFIKDKMERVLIKAEKGRKI